MARTCRRKPPKAGGTRCALPVWDDLLGGMVCSPAGNNPSDLLTESLVTGWRRNRLFPPLEPADMINDRGETLSDELHLRHVRVACTKLHRTPDRRRCGYQWRCFTGRWT
eukprot:14909891-Alexandrium_andersonii.AAC.1